MSNLITRDLSLQFIPSSLHEHFIEMVFNSYFQAFYSDLKNISIHLDYFAVLAISHLETGNAFRYSDDLNRAELNQGIIDTYSQNVVCEVQRVLNHYHLFYAEDDSKRNKNTSQLCPYDFIGKFHNMPFIEVW